ncbi:Flp family type IVb pilin [Aliivibrio fischeri]|uniref:Flp family type IVb pilin n=1 Tax=Aliivibrio fischeri TaxID=668 RepID=UPI00084C56F9|nr:Flp family type IVb pilin [Aliivibrio fischeri]OED58166.1 fimbrial protein [Aliivibrio fischeri]
MLTKLYVHSKLAMEAFKEDQRGVTAIEYAIIGVSISAVVLLMFNGTLKDALTGAMTTISKNITSANVTS